jgi:hypothetical protein
LEHVSFVPSSANIVWVNALVCAIDGDVEAKSDAGKTDVIRIAHMMRMKMVFFMRVFLRILYCFENRKEREREGRSSWSRIQPGSG